MHMQAEWKRRYCSKPFAARQYEEVVGHHHAPAALLPGKTGTQCTGDWVGFGAGLDGHGIARPPPGFDPRPPKVTYFIWHIFDV